jgi:hypothetical protein
MSPRFTNLMSTATTHDNISALGYKGTYACYKIDIVVPPGLPDSTAVLAQHTCCLLPHRLQNFPSCHFQAINGNIITQNPSMTTDGLSPESSTSMYEVHTQQSYEANHVSRFA